MNLFKLKGATLSSYITLFTTSISFVVYSRMPDVMLTHFDLSGNPDGASTKLVALSSIPLLMFIHAIVGVPLMTKIPDKVMGSRRGMISNLIVGSVLIPMMLVHFWIILENSELKSIFSPNHAINLAILLPTVFMVSLMGMVGDQNGAMGLRNKWTLASKEVWRKSHEFCAKYLWWLNLLMFLCFIFNVLFLITFVLWLLVIGFVPNYYSYKLYKKLEAEGKIE